MTPMDPRAVGCQGWADVVKVRAPRVAEAFEKKPQPQRGGAQMKNTAAVKPNHPMRGFEVAVDVNRLVEIKLPVVTPPQGVYDVMRIFGAETGEHHAAFVGLAVAVGVPEMEQFGALADIRAAVA